MVFELNCLEFSHVGDGRQPHGGALGKGRKQEVGGEASLEQREKGRKLALS